MFELNSDQRTAIETKGNILLIACPGSGKTRVLSEKIALELNDINSKHQYIIGLTFTNRAAEEIERRIDKLGVPTSQLWIGTIHSFCLQWILNPYYIYLEELRFGFSIIDDFLLEELTFSVKEKYGIKFFEDFNTRLDREGKYLNSDDNKNKAAKEIHESLIKDKKIDYDLLLYFSYLLLKRFSKINSRLSKLFRYIFIDEFQDTQDLQYAIVEGLVKGSQGNCKLFMVGDPDQSIFKSLGGRAKSIQDLRQEIGDFPIQELRLSGNYRSTQRIIDFYRNFQITDTEINSLTNYSDEKGMITYNTCITKKNLSPEIARIIKDNIESGVHPNGICVIAPRWSFLISMSRQLKLLLPHTPFDAPGLTILPRNPENFWFQLSRLFLTRPSPNMFYKRLCWANKIIEYLGRMTGIEGLGESISGRKLLKNINKISINETDGIRYLKSAFAIFLQQLDIDIDDYSVLEENWECFFDGIEKRYELAEFQTAPRTIEYFSEMFKVSNGVVINTCQGIKGEEFNTVIAFGLLRGYVPHWNSIYGGTEELDSNNLLYVIASRAKKNLHLFSECDRFTTKKKLYVPNRQLITTCFEYD